MGTRKFHFGNRKKSHTPDRIGDRVYLWALACETAEEKLEKLFKTFSRDKVSLSSVDVRNPDKEPGLKIVATFEVVMPTGTPDSNVPGINFFEIAKNVNEKDIQGLDICVTADFDSLVEKCVNAGEALLRELQTNDEILKNQIEAHAIRYAAAFDNKQRMKSEKENATAYLKEIGALNGLPREARALPNQPFLPKGNKHTSWAVKLETPQLWPELWVGWEYVESQIEIEADLNNAREFIEFVKSIIDVIDKYKPHWTLNHLWWRVEKKNVISIKLIDMFNGNKRGKTPETYIKEYEKPETSITNIKRKPILKGKR